VPFQALRRPPKNIFPKDYDEYVFKEGRLIGDFDNMYRHAERIPWDQDKRCNHWTAQVGLEMLWATAPYGSILEIGCGLGYIAAKLKPLTKAGRGAVDAFDISPDAVRKARRLHPGIRFYADDILRPDFKPKRRYRLVVVRELFWYVFPQMDRAVRNILSCVVPGGYLYIGQYFPALDRPFIGKETIPSPEALLNLFPSLVPLSTAVIRNHPLANDGPILHHVGRRPR
jgi:SAM-dependent methyltransferase